MGYLALLVPVLLLIWFWWVKRQRVTHSMAGGIHPDITLPHEQEFELYHNDFSLCSKKVRVCMSELELPYKPHHIDLIETGSYETLSRHYLKVNPAGILPVLVHNGHPIYESHDIISYLAEQCKDPTKQLVPEGNEQRALMQEWKDSASIIGDDPLTDLGSSAAACVAILTLPLFAAGIKTIPYVLIFEGALFHRLRIRAFLFLTLKVVGLGRFFKIGKFMTAMEKAKAAFAVHLQELEDLLADGRSWIVGDQFTLADVSWMVLFDRLVEADWYNDFLGGSDFPHVQAYWQRMKARPSFRDGLEGFRHLTVTEATLRIQQQKISDPQFEEAMAKGCPAAAISLQNT